MANDYIKHLIEVNKFANAEINQLEDFIKVVEIHNEKEKATFGNACVMLRSLRAVADTTEAMLINENVLQDDNGDFYQKIEDEHPTPEDNKKHDNEDK